MGIGTESSAAADQLPQQSRRVSDIQRAEDILMDARGRQVLLLDDAYLCVKTVFPVSVRGRRRTGKAFGIPFIFQ